MELDLQSAAMDNLLIAPAVAVLAVVRIALYIFVPLYIWKIWKKVRHLPG